MNKIKTVPPDIFMGWARCAVAEGMVKEPPLYVTKAAHPDCTEPLRQWAELINIEQQRAALLNGEIEASEVTTGNGYETWNTADNVLFQRAMIRAMALAWGDS